MCSKLEYEKITEYDWHDIKELNLTKELVLERIFEFYRWEGFDLIEPTEDTIKGLEAIAHHELYVITARPKWMKEKTEKWITKYFPQIKDIILTNEYSFEGKKQEKIDISTKLQLKGMVEDKLTTAIDHAFAGITAYLVKRPWNQKERYPDGIIPVNGMQEAAKYINSFKKNPKLTTICKNQYI